jgi:hypothetical protein
MTDTFTPAPVPVAPSPEQVRLQVQFEEARAAAAVQQAAVDRWAAEAERLEAEAEAAPDDRHGAGIAYAARIHAAEAMLARDTARAAISEMQPELADLEHRLAVAKGSSGA